MHGTAAAKDEVSLRPPAVTRPRADTRGGGGRELGRDRCQDGLQRRIIGSVAAGTRVNREDLPK
jgi:hypothetical protein